MCGITGYINFDSKKNSSISTLKKMTDSLIHRGPDEEGHFIENNIALGHRRLSIIDFLTGQQPMKFADENLVIVYNGEIYNFIELRDELQKNGFVFFTKSDTEIILAAYQKWGLDCVKKFNGMWAFALWDKRKRRLFCSRDRVGEKPFFYTVFKNTFVFGSEIKPLFAYGATKKINSEVLDLYFCFTYIPAPHTFFKNIYKLKPGYSLIIENCQIKLLKYWDIEYPKESSMRTDKKKIFTEFEELFYDAIKIRMRSDAAFGAFLSGGLDSTSVVSGMSKFSDRPINTYTIGFDNKNYDERDLAELVAKKFQTNHLERVIDKDDLKGLIRKLALIYDEPFGDSSALPTYIVSKIASQHVKMVLTGDGGDEALCGYTIHQGEKFSHQYSQLPLFLRMQLIPAALNFLLFLTLKKSRKNFLHINRIVNSANMEVIDRIESKQNGFNKFARKQLIINNKLLLPARDFIEEVIQPVINRNNFTKLNYWLLKVSLPDDMLCKVDRASMANGLEARIPFLDYRIIELLSSVNMNVKLKGYTRKNILLKTVGKNLPKKIISRKKMGFTVPLNEWFNDDSHSLLKHYAFKASNSGMINRRFIEELFKTYRIDRNYSLNSIWVLAILSFFSES